MRLIKSFRRKEARRIENGPENDPGVTGFRFFWMGVTGFSLTLAAFSAYSVDWDTKKPIKTVEIDHITTASIRNDAVERSSTRPRENRRNINELNQRIDTLSGVIKRLRSEQSVMAARIAELDRELADKGRPQKTVRLIEQPLPSTPNVDIQSTNSVDSNQTANVPIPVIARPIAATRVAAADAEEDAIQQEEFGEANDEIQLIEQNAALEQDLPAAIETEGASTTTTIAKTPDVVSPEPEPSPRQASAPPVTIRTPANVDPTTTASISDLQTAFGLDLGINSTPARATELWSTLRRGEPELFSELVPRYIETRREEGETRLIAGPFTNAADAIRACVTLRKSDSFCKTTVFPR